MIDVNSFLARMLLTNIRRELARTHIHASARLVTLARIEKDLADAYDKKVEYTVRLSNYLTDQLLDELTTEMDLLKDDPQPDNLRITDLKTLFMELSYAKDTCEKFDNPKH